MPRRCTVTKRFSQLPEATALTDDDIIALTDAPSGAAASKKMTASNLRAELHKSRIYPLAFVLDEGGGVLSTGTKVEVRIIEPGNVERWAIGGDHSTGMSVNVYKGANFPVAISGVPFIPVGFSNAQSAQDNSLGTTKAVAADDWLAFVTQHVNTVTRAPVEFVIRRT
jgi:hypothetical protein